MKRFIRSMIVGIAAGMGALLLGYDSWTTAPLITLVVIGIVWAASWLINNPNLWIMEAECIHCDQLQLIYEEDIRPVGKFDPVNLPDDALVFDCERCGIPNQVYREDLPDDVKARVLS